MQPVGKKASPTSTTILPEQVWADICAAVGRAGLTPEPEARSVLTLILFRQYPAFVYDRKRVAAALREAEQMLKRLDVFAELYRRRWWPQLPENEFKAILNGRVEPFVPGNKKTEHDLWSIARLRRRPLGLLARCRVLRSANARKANTQRVWLIGRLCDVWLDHFNGPHLGVARPSQGGKPYGPLIDYLLAAMRAVIPEHVLPDPETLDDAITRERRERENARQLKLELEAHGGLTLKK
jgi:hypothetical protein